MCKFKVQTFLRTNRTIYFNVYVKGSNPATQAKELVKKYAIGKGYGVDPYVGIGNNGIVPCDQYDDHFINCVYDGDWYGHDKLLYKGGDK